VLRSVVDGSSSRLCPIAGVSINNVESYDLAATIFVCLFVCLLHVECVVNVIHFSLTKRVLKKRCVDCS
jgi:hypothetical protein